MFGRQAKSLRMRIDGQQYQFPSVADFEFALVGRVGLPLSRLKHLLSQPTEALFEDAEQVRRTAVRLTQVVAGGAADSQSISGFLVAFDMLLITQDHGWRAIIAALAKFDSSADAYKRAALVRYGQYLSAREDATRTILSGRADIHGRAGSDASGGDHLGLRETLIVDLASTMTDEDDDSYDRLPKGEPITVSLDPEESVPLMLVKHRCQLLGGASPVFVDSIGQETSLQPGKTVVGRDARSDIRIPTERRDISRKHLIVEFVDEQLVRLTDVSSLGTFIPPRYLDKTGT